MKYNDELTSEEQKNLLNFFSRREIEDLCDNFKTIFRMASFETNGDLDQDQRTALFNFYNLIELLEEIKNNS